MATTNNGKDGGLLKGKPHYDKNGKSLGGIKAIVTDTKQMVELEGGEVIINKEASKKHWKELSRINQSAGNGVPILPPDKAMADTEEYKQGGRTIEFNPNHIPQKWIYNYAKKIKDKHPKVWALGGNEFGNKAFENLERALKRGYWTENEEWMYVKWQSFNARHKGDFRIAGVIANLKWLNKVDKGWDFMKNLIETEIKKRENKLETGGELAKGIKSEREHIGTATKLYKHQITPKQAPESIAKEHLAEDSQYYTKLEEFESKFDTGGGIEQKPVFEFMKSNPMQQARAISSLEKRINTDGKIIKIHEWIESFEKGLEVGTSKLHSSKSEKGYVEKPTIGDNIVFTKAEQDYYKYIEKGGESYTSYLIKLKAYTDKLAEKSNIEREETKKIREQEAKLQREASLKGKNEQIKMFIEKGKDAVLELVLNRYVKAIENLKNERQSKSKDEEIAYNEKMIAQRTDSVNESYIIATTLYKIVNGEVEKKYDWKVGDKVLYAFGKIEPIETVIIDIVENGSFKVEKREGIYNQYISYDGLLPLKNEPEEQKPTHKEFEVKYYINTGKKHNVKTWICAQNRNEAIDIAKKDDDRYTELISCKPTGNTSWSSSCNKEDAEFDENDEGADEEKHFDSNYKPIFWHLTQNEFCEYAENYEVDTRLDGTKARLECKDFYKYVVVLPLLDDSAERNVFLLAVETGLLPYEKVEEIINSVGAWKESNRFVKELLDYDRVKNYGASIWLIPKDLYLSADYYKNNFTKTDAKKFYGKQIYKYAILDDKQLHEFLQKGIVKLKDVEARLKESEYNITKADERFLDKLRGYAKTFSSKNKLKALKLLLEEDLPIKKEFETDLTDSELLKHVTNNGLEMIKKAENQGGVLINRKRLVENATKISQLTWMKGLKKDKGLPLEAVAEAIQYEVGYNDNWNDLKNSIEKGGYELNKDTVERIKSIGIELPFETYEMFDAQMQKHIKEHERKKSLFSENERKFVDKLIKDNYANVKYNKVKLENLAKEFGIKEQNLAKELAELSISFVARVYAHDTELTPKERYKKIVKLYESQVNLSHRTSESIMLQQYSTPAPIGYLAGLFCGFDKEGGNYFEPSAGNGLLTIAGKVKDFTVNEIDTVRNRNLSVLGFKKVLKQDASEPFKEFEHKFDAVITNPPFGKTEVVTYGKSDIKSLEQVMSLRALDTMKDNGRCAIIIGGHTEYDKEGRIQSGKNRTYFVYLYKHYNVMDVINISGRHLYSRQGTAFNTRLILIDGRKETPSGFPPLIENPIPMNEINSPTPVDNFDVLWERINKSI